MPQEPNRFSRFWQELKHRKTDRVIVAYAAAAFGILQLAEILSNVMALPEWTMNMIIIILAVGFPVTAAFSWFFDITPGGIEKTKPPGERKKPKAEAEVRKWKNTTLISFIIIIALLFYNIIKSSIASGEEAKAEKSIVVQPFSCLTEERDLLLKGATYTAFINGTLLDIENISLKTWPPNLNFQKSEKSYTEIGRELNVTFILKGILSKPANRIIFIVQLIRAKSENILWAKNYELDSEGNNFYDIQRDIAINISNKLNTGISDRGKNRINKRPSGNQVALRNYLEGSAVSQQVIFNVATGKRIFEELINTNLFEKAINSFSEAIENDSSFALAYAKRAIIRSWAYYTGYLDKTSIELCKADIDRALQLDNDLVEAQIALGFYYYYCTFEYQKALESFSHSNSLQPNNWHCLYYMALVHRALGNWNKSQKLLEKVLEFNPQDPLVLTNIGISETYLRHYDEAISYQNKAIELAPGWPASYINKISAIILKNGNTSEARRLLDEFNVKTGNNSRIMTIQLDIYDESYEDALHQIELSEPSDFYDDHGEEMLLYGEIYSYLNNDNAALKFYRSALEYYKQELAKEPGNCRNISSMGIAYAGLSQKPEAVESGLKALDLAKNNALRYNERMIDMAKIYIMVREYDKCLEKLEYLLKNPSDISIKYLQLDPVWKPLYENPGFKKLIEKY